MSAQQEDAPARAEQSTACPRVSLLILGGANLSPVPLSSKTQWKVSLPRAGRLELDDPQERFQPKPFSDSVKRDCAYPMTEMKPVTKRSCSNRYLLFDFGFQISSHALVDALRQQEDGWKA